MPCLIITDRYHHRQPQIVYRYRDRPFVLPLQRSYGGGNASPAHTVTVTLDPGLRSLLIMTWQGGNRPASQAIVRTCMIDVQCGGVRQNVYGASQQRVDVPAAAPPTKSGGESRSNDWRCVDYWYLHRANFEQGTDHRQYR